MTVRLQVNNENLMKNLAKSFTGDSNLFKELAQNARRAKASCVAIEVNKKNQEVIFVDDGCGIDNFQNLFTVAESGWDKDVQDKENPFGLGFLMAIYSCKGIEIESNGKKLVASKAEILQFKELALTTSSTTVGTKITMKGVSESIFNFCEDKKLENIFQSFPIEVKLNGVAVPRDFSLCALEDSSEYEKIEGSLGLYFVRKGFVNTMTSSSMMAFFQGFKIYDVGYGLDRDCYVHLNESQFEARVPDRDVLINEKSEINRVYSEINAILKERVLLHKGDFDWLCQNLRAVENHDLISELNKFDKMPPASFLVFEGEQVKSSSNCDGDHYSNDLKVYERSELKDMIVFQDSDLYFDNYEDDIRNFTLPLYLERLSSSYVILNRKMDKDHWIYKQTIEMSEIVESLSVEVVEGRAPSVSRDFYSDLDIVICKSFKINGKYGQIEVDDCSVITSLVEDNNFHSVALIPSKDESYGILYQMCNFMNEYSYDESLDYEYQEAYSRWLGLEAVKDNPEQYMEKLLSGLDKSNLAGQQFIISFDQEGVARISSISGVK